MEGDFFGRESELDILVKRITHGQNVLITGERRIGKTSLLNKVFTLVESHIDHSVPVWLEGDGPCRSVHELVVEISERLHQFLPSFPSSKSTTVKKTFDRLEALAKGGTRLLLFVNDLDDMTRGVSSQGEASELGSFVRSVIDLGHIIVCATSLRGLTHTRHESERAPLFNVLNELALGLFNAVEAIHFLSESSMRSGDRLLESECAFFTELVGLAPLHLQVTGFALFAQDNFIGSGGERRLDFMVAAIEQAVPELTSRWLYAIDSLTSHQQSLLGRAAKNQVLLESAEVQYLRQRGFISSGEERFKSMGSLYRDFLLSLDLDPENDRRKQNSYWAFTKDLTQVAVRTLLESGIKSYVK